MDANRAAVYHNTWKASSVLRNKNNNNTTNESSDEHSCDDDSDANPPSSTTTLEELVVDDNNDDERHSSDNNDDEAVTDRNDNPPNDTKNNKILAKFSSSFEEEVLFASDSDETEEEKKRQRQQQQFQTPPLSPEEKKANEPQQQPGTDTAKPEANSRKVSWGVTMATPKTKPTTSPQHQPPPNMEPPVVVVPVNNKNKPTTVIQTNTGNSIQFNPETWANTTTNTATHAEGVSTFSFPPPAMMTRVTSLDNSSWSRNSPTTRHHAPKQSLQLLDLMDTRNSPFGMEADEYIIKTLEEVDPTMTKHRTAVPTHTNPAVWSQAQQSLLPLVPPDASPDTFEYNDDDDEYQQQQHQHQQQRENESSTSNNSRAASLQQQLNLKQPSNKNLFQRPENPQKQQQNKQHKKTKSTAQNLFDLTMDLHNLHGKSSSSTNDTSIVLEDINKSNTDVDMYVRNAATIMKRMKSASSKKLAASSTTATAEPNVPVVSASDRWKKLSTVVHTANALQGDTKKTDDPQPREEKNNDDNEGGDFKHKVKYAKSKIENEFRDFEDWVLRKKNHLLFHVKLAVLGVILPLIILSAILFYGFGNPPCGTSTQCLEHQFNIVRNDTSKPITNQSLLNLLDTASISWWMLFVVRQMITLGMALAAECVLVEYLALTSKWIVTLFGPFVTLFIVQARGWPLIVFCWGIFNFIFLYGANPFANHWLYYQDSIWMFNSRNPSGAVTNSKEYRIILSLFVVVSFLVAVKRFFLGLYLGKYSYFKYAEELAKVMKKAVLIGRVATLAREIEDEVLEKQTAKINESLYNFSEDTSKNEQTEAAEGQDEQDEVDYVFDNLEKSSERKTKIIQLLGEWEDPDKLSEVEESVSISNIIQFRQSLTYLNTGYPFGFAYGPAAKRVECVGSGQEVYNRLLLRNNNEGEERIMLKFNTIALLAVNKDGSLNEQLVKDLIRLFRPERDGTLSLIDFVKSIDAAYKELRLLRASVASSSKMDRAFGGIITCIFYFVLWVFILGFMGLQPIVLFASVTSFFVGFSYMIKNAASNYFEGLLFILVRNPYDIGDRINVSNPEKDTPNTGSPGWIVKDVTLFSTTVIYAATNECATYSNGALASSRIINAARSPKATICFLFKFPIDTRYQRIVVFKEAVEEFVKARPREWAAFCAFRATRVQADEGFVEYICVAQHRELWQSVGAVLTSKADLSSFALELMKKMDMRYVAPPLPIDLNVKQSIPSFFDPNAMDPDQASTLRQRTGTFDEGGMVSEVTALFNQ